MVNRDAVALILGRRHSMADGYEVLGDLEGEGYRVVQAGMVPQFDDLDSIVSLLKVLGDIGGQIHDPRKAREAAHQIEWLRDLAILVLRIDRDVALGESGD